jgi:hypothetical protein
MTSATVGSPQDRGRGWRMALRYALGDTPQPTLRETRHQPKATNIYETLPLFQSEES